MEESGGFIAVQSRLIAERMQAFEKEVLFI